MQAKRIGILLGLVAVIGAAGWLAVDRVRHPKGTLLLDRSDAAWVRLETPRSVHHHDLEGRTVRFRRVFHLEAVPAKADLTVRAFRSAAVRVNGLGVADGDDRLEVAGLLRTGRNALVIDVANDRGPPALLVSSDALPIATPAEWQVRAGDSTWQRATPLSERRPFPASRELAPAWEHLRARLHLVALFFCVGVLASRIPTRRWHPAGVRWGLVAAFVALCANNISRIPLNVGFDVLGHYEYIAFLLENGRLPLASDGWVMFQPPLFYMVAAIPAALFAGRVDPDTILVLLRIVPMLCGAGMIEIAYRSARRVFPERAGLQIACTAIGGFLPINLYISQTVGNEPLSGLLTAAAVYLVIRLLVEAPAAPSWRACAGLGLVFGLALLAKVSAFVLLPAILLAIASLGRLARAPLARTLQAVGAFIGSGVAVAGWYYLRNWREFGRPFVGGWEGGRGYDWWQDPGYRIGADLYTFGESLSHPIFASALGFWDGLYATLWLDGLRNLVKSAAASPQWNHEFMLCLALLSLPLSAAGIVGFVRALRVPRTGPERAQAFAVACITSFLLAMLAMFLTVPTYSSVKSSYALGLAPCFAIVMTAGISRLPSGALSRAFVGGTLAVWLAFAYVAFFAW
jgi:hypothetical protein